MPASGSILKDADMHPYLKDLPMNKRTFVLKLLASDTFNPTEAARAAGYKNPSSMGKKLYSEPRVRQAIAAAIKAREARDTLKAENVLEYLRSGLYLNPLKFCVASDDGKGWMVSDLSQVPEEYGPFIDGIEQKTVTTREGDTITYYKIKFISKSVLLPLAMKHLGLLESKGVSGGAVNININWGDLRVEHVPGSGEQKRIEQQQTLEPWERKIKEVESSIVDAEFEEIKDEQSV